MKKQTVADATLQFRKLRLRSRHNVVNPEVERKWKSTELGSILLKTNGGNRPGMIFTLMSYNVLAQDLIAAHPHIYKHHDKGALEWNIRWKNLGIEIRKHNCDILCLQEVQESHLDRYYNVELIQLGYKGIFKKKTGDKPDGCAIYYKEDLFQLIEYTSVEYLQPVPLVLDRDNIAIIAKFAPKSNLSAEFIVATTHLLYNPRRADVRLAQTQLLLTELDRFAYKKVNRRKYLPIIMTGDLNSEPDSPICKLITNGTLKYENLSIKSLEPNNENTKPVVGKMFLPQHLKITDTCQHDNILSNRQANKKSSRQEEFKQINLLHSEQMKENQNLSSAIRNAGLFGRGTLSHDLCLKSVYKHKIKDQFEGTTYQDGWITVDYIFYSGLLQNNRIREDKLKLVSSFTLPLVKDLYGLMIPNHKLGSDHISLLAKFKLEY